MKLTKFIRSVFCLKNQVIFVFFCLFAPYCCSETKTVRVGSFEWEPYSGKALPGGGFLSEVIKEAFSRVGYSVDYEYYSWKTALAKAKRGEVDALLGLYWTEERSQFLSYSDVIFTVKDDIITLEDSDLVYTGLMDDFKGYKVGALSDTVPSDELQKAGVDVYFVNFYLESFQKLLAGRVDAIVVPEHFVRSFISRSNITTGVRIKISDHPYAFFAVYLGFPKMNPDFEQLTLDFNKGLRSMNEDGTLSQLFKKHKIIEYISSPDHRIAK